MIQVRVADNTNGFFFSQVIYGTLYPKGNNRIIGFRIHKGKKIRASKKSTGAQKFVDDFMLQCKRIAESYEGKVSLIATIYYPNERFDLDPSLLMDCIQKAGVIKNDRQIWHKDVRKDIDRKNPRVQFAVMSIGGKLANGRKM